MSAGHDRDHSTEHPTAYEAFEQQMLAVYQATGDDMGADRVCGMVLGYVKGNGDTVITMFSPHTSDDGQAMAVGLALGALLESAEAAGILDTISDLCEKMTGNRFTVKVSTPPGVN